MNSTLAHRLATIQPSATLAVNARAKALAAEGKHIVNLSVGEPDFDTPDFVKAAAIKAIESGLTKYTAVGGTPELKQAIIAKFRKDNRLDFKANEILVSCGAKHSFFNLFAALLNKDDEVIIPAPYWVSYSEMASLHEGKPVVVTAGIKQHFKITAQQLSAAITAKSRIIILNSPSNPTGMEYSDQELQALADVLKKHPQVWIATDDIYEHIRWTKRPFVNILNLCPELAPRCVVINGVSKTYAMTGWRIGYAAAPAALISAMETIQSQATSNPCSISQAAAVAALQGDQSCIQPMVKAFKERHDFVVEHLNRLPGVKCLAADGTFYAFPNVAEAMMKHGIKTDTEFATYLLDQAGVATVPGTAFGAPGYVRLSYATSKENLVDAMQRMAKVV